MRSWPTRLYAYLSWSAGNPFNVQSPSAGALSCESSELGARFPHSSKKRLKGSATTELSKTPAMVRETADQAGLRSSIPGTATATTMTGRNRIAIASACIPGPLNGQSFRRTAVSHIIRATGAQIIPPIITNGSGNSRRSSQPSLPANAAVQWIIIRATASINPVSSNRSWRISFQTSQHGSMSSGITALYAKPCHLNSWLVTSSSASAKNPASQNCSPLYLIGLGSDKISATGNMLARRLIEIRADRSSISLKYQVKV